MTEAVQPTVTLRDGRQVSSWSEEWRAECEARWVCNLPTIDQRRAHLDGVEKVRGKVARKALEAEVRAIWDAERRPEIERLLAAGG